jgi:hypothetical protein
MVRAWARFSTYNPLLKQCILAIQLTSYSDDFNGLGLGLYTTPSPEVGAAPRHSEVILTPTQVRTEWVFDFEPARTPARRPLYPSNTTLCHSVGCSDSSVSLIFYSSPQCYELVSARRKPLASELRRKPSQAPRSGNLWFGSVCVVSVCLFVCLFLFLVR